MITQQRVMEILNKGSGQDRTSLICDRFLATLIILNLVCICLESVQTIALQYATALLYLEIFSVSVLASNTHYGFGLVH